MKIGIVGSGLVMFAGISSVTLSFAASRGRNGLLQSLWYRVN
jgi:hypothetical protein